MRLGWRASGSMVAVLFMGTVVAGCGGTGDTGLDSLPMADIPDTVDGDTGVEDAFKSDTSRDDGPLDTVWTDQSPGDQGQPPPDEGHETDVFDPGTGPGVFVEGCPIPGKALARRMASPEALMHGPNAIGRAGDFLLANEHAAFVVQSADHRNAYYLYGGIVVDAVALSGCDQAGHERFEELGLVTGVFDTQDPMQSVLRMFRADTVQVLSDGSDGGPAVVRALGEDDRFWLIEQTLTRESFKNRKIRPWSGPLGLEIQVDYILDPGSRFLRIEITYRNLNSSGISLVGASVALFGNTTRLLMYHDDVLSIGGYGLWTGVPWMAASAPDGAWALSLETQGMAVATISGITAAVDLGHLLGGDLWLAPAGLPGEAVTTVQFLSVGPGDWNSAVHHMQSARPYPLPDRTWLTAPVQGTVVDASDESPVDGAEVEIQARNAGGNWLPIDGFRSGPDGMFQGLLPDLGSAMPIRLVARKEGRPLSEPLEIDPATPGNPVLPMEKGGLLRIDVSDDNDAAVPCLVTLWKGGSAYQRIYGFRGDEVPVVPGEYDVTVTRGYEYSPWNGSVVIPPGGTGVVAAVISKGIDTSGFLSLEAHCHATPSPDSAILVDQRIRSAAGEGVDVIVATDHEFVGSWQSGIDDTGLGPWIAAVSGSEVTASLPEHMNMYPVEPRPDIDGRGGIVPWYGMDMAQLTTAIRERGAGIVQLNHPRNGNYMTLIQWNRLTGQADLADPTSLGFPQDATLWSWDFDTIEMMNGLGSPFLNPSRPHHTGLFDDWMAFLNLGRMVTAVGTSDAHGLFGVGSPRVYFQSSTSDPAAFDQGDLVDSLKTGRALISAGAFARVRANDSGGMGDLVQAPEGQVSLHIRIEAIPEIDVAYVKVYANCDQVLSIPTDDPDGTIKMDRSVDLVLARDAHLVVAAFGTRPMPLAMRSYTPSTVPRVLTNAIFVDVDGNGSFDPPGGKACVYDMNPPNQPR